MNLPKPLAGKFDSDRLADFLPKPQMVQIIIEVPVSHLDFDGCYSSIDARGRETQYDDDVSCATYNGLPVEFPTEADAEIAVVQFHTQVRERI